jgi:peptidyl-prolyl cis-trans isomerase SurA
MYRLLLIVSFVLGVFAPALSAAPDPSPAPVALDRILVIVNDDVVTQSELDARLPAIKRQLADQHVRLPPEDVLRRQVLERMIMERLQLQLAAQLGIRISDARVDETVARLAAQNKMSPKEFNAELAREGITPAAFRHEVHNQLIIQQLVDREINSRVSVSDSEVDAFLATRKDQDAGKQFNVSHILIGIPEGGRGIEAAQQRAQDLVRQLRQGADFQQLAIANSQDPNALEGGNLGWKTAGQLPALFVSALDKMQPGEVSDPLRSPNGFHILKLNEVRGESRVPVVQTHARHILIRVTELVSPADALAKIRQLRERIENGEDFAALARANSDDPGSALNGGDLGWINPGQTVPDFEKAMNALKVNELSQPVQSPYGVHLIQVLGRREADISAEKREIDARQQIHARKADERYEQWLRQLRDEAFVQYVGKDAG